MYLAIIEPALLIVGFAIFASSIVIYVLRTGNLKSVLMFWQAEMAMKPNEFYLHRLGILIMILGIILRFFNHW